jgi:allantoin racemase
MIRVAFVVGQYPPEEQRKREQAALSYSSADVEVGILQVAANPYNRLGIPEVEAVAPLFHQAFIKAEKEGYDAVVPLGMLDLGVEGGRCLVDIPVVAPFEAALHVASLLGDKFGLINYESYSTPRTLARARKYGMEHFIAGMQSVQMPKSDMTANRDLLVETFLAHARKLIDEKGAQVIIPAGITQCPVQMSAEFLSKELGVPVVEGIGAPIRMAAMLAGLGYRHSRIRYPRTGP